MKPQSKSFIWLIPILALAGCNLPTRTQVSPEVAFTAAAMTLQAEATRMASSPGPQTPVTPIIPATQEPTLTIPPTPTSTPRPTATVTPIPCNMFTFIDDVTVEDYDDFSPGAAFIKTWRIKNVGACPWTTAYSLAFYQDNAMNGPATVALLGTVNPGQMVDLSVNLTAPASPGRYTGKWALKDQNGAFFFSTLGNPFWVIIDVVNSPTKTITLNAVAVESGSVRSTATVHNLLHVGDTAANAGAQVFIGFDISGIPAGSTIDEVKIDLGTGLVIAGAPFTTLHCLTIHPQDYGTLDAGDYFPGVPAGALLQWCDTPGLSTAIADTDLKNIVQGKVGTSRVQFRLQFKDMTSDGNGIEDMVQLGAPKLIITYTQP